MVRMLNEELKIKQCIPDHVISASDFRQYL